MTDLATRSKSPSAGPERFYYDTSTYTGTWRNGGPDAHNNFGERRPGPGAFYPDSLRPGLRNGKTGFQPGGSSKYFGSASRRSTSAPPTPSKVGQRNGQGYGPERFYYDRSSYTGVWKHGGPTTVDKRQMTPKGAWDHYYGTLRPNLRSGNVTTRLQVCHPSPNWIEPSPGAHDFWMEDTMYANSTRRPSSAPPTGRAQMTHSDVTMRMEEETAVAQERGPERFYYDKSTWTGVHRHGGPSTNDRREMNTNCCWDHYLGTLRPHLTKGGTRLTVERSPTVLSSSMRRHVIGDRTTSEPPTARYATEDGVGPERFYYDKSTYTGTHKNGGPDATDRRQMNPDSAWDHYLGNLRPDMRANTTLTVGQPSPDLFPRAPALRSRPWSAPPTRSREASSVDRQIVGPERFYYDTNTYTGVHKNGGPTIKDPREMNPTACCEHYVDSMRPHLRGKGVGGGTSLTVERPSPVIMTPGGNLESDFVPATTLLGCSAAAYTPQSSFVAPPTSAGPVPPAAEGEEKGPEHFYYDRSTYTGVHRHGGPTHYDVRGTQNVERPLSRSASAASMGATDPSMRYAGSYAVSGRQRTRQVQPVSHGRMWGSGGTWGVDTPSLGCTGTGLNSTWGSQDGSRSARGGHSRRNRQAQRRGPGHFAPSAVT